MFHEEQDVGIGFPKQRFLLAVLLAEAGSPLRTARLIERLWGDGPPASARNALYTYVAQLRGALAPYGTELVRRHGGYTLDVPPDSVDLHRFHALISAAKQAQDGGEGREHAAERKLALLTEALDLHRGTPLEGLTTPWSEALRVRVAADRRWALLSRNGILLRCGRHAEIVSELTGATAAAPLDEPLAAQLMLALHRSGRRAAAVQHYHRVREALARELGVPPGAPLQRAYQRLLHDDPLVPAPQVPLRKIPYAGQAPHGAAGPHGGPSPYGASGPHGVASPHGAQSAHGARVPYAVRSTGPAPAVGR